MPTFYKVVSTCRSRSTRDVRRRNPVHEGLTQFIGGTHRLVRGKPVVLPEQEIVRLLSELKDKKKIGLLTVTTLQDIEVDLCSLQPVAPLPTAPPKPTVPVDSISRDDPPPVAALEALPGTTPLSAKAEFKMPVSIGVDLASPPVTEQVEPAGAPVELGEKKEEHKVGKKRRR